MIKLTCLGASAQAQGPFFHTGYPQRPAHSLPSTSSYHQCWQGELHAMRGCISRWGLRKGLCGGQRNLWRQRAGLGLPCGKAGGGLRWGPQGT